MIRTFIITVLMTAWAAAAAAQSTGSGVSFFPRAQFGMGAEHLSGTDDVRFRWDANFGGELDLIDYTVGRVIFAAGGVMVAVFFTSEPGKEFIAFGRESVKEVKKVVWPTRKESIQMTAYVFAFVVVMALFLWLTDKTLEWVFYDLILGWKQ